MSNYQINSLIGLVGCGRWGINILRDLLILGCQVVVADPSEEARQKALSLGASKVVATLEELPADVDGLIVATSTITHFEVIKQLLPRKRPIFCEKPLTANLEEARSLIAEGQEWLFLMDKWRYHTGIEAIRTIANQGLLGKIQYLKTRRVQWGNPHKDVDAVWILLPHDLSIVQHILGYIPNPRAAFGEVVGNDLEGVTAFLGENPGAVIEISARNPIPERLISVTCEQGVILLRHPLAEHLEIHRLNQDPELLKISTEFPLLRELRQFCQFLAGGDPPLTNGLDALKATEALVQIRDLAWQSSLRI